MVFRDFEFVHGVEKSEPVHGKQGKCIVVPQGEYSRMRTTNLNLMMQKGCRAVQMIIAHKGLPFMYIFKR